ncbi:hypothetical protein TNCV_1936441 [Trichonephila clavipes]|nr:hypothetical protein TNCV_1936441 [Trichonephila clavipes]
MWNGGVSIESRFFPRRVCIAQRTSFKRKGGKLKGAKHETGATHRDKHETTNFKYQMGKGAIHRDKRETNKLQISNGKRRSKQAKHVMDQA